MPIQARRGKPHVCPKRRKSVAGFFSVKGMVMRKTAPFDPHLIASSSANRYPETSFLELFPCSSAIIDEETFFSAGKFPIQFLGLIILNGMTVSRG
jgi:hypothetical protein